MAGTYTLTSTTANAPSHAPVGDRFTAFTGALLRALDDADPLTLDQIFVVVDRDLVAQNLPRPQRRVVNTAGNLALSRGPATQSHTEPPDSDTVRFTRTYRSLTEAGLRVFGAVFLILLHSTLLLVMLYCLLLFPFVLLLLTVGADSNTATAFLGVKLPVFTALVLPILTVVTIARPRTRHEKRVVSVLKKLISGVKDARVRELVVDRSGLTVRRTFVRTHLPWRDIVHVGVLQPERRTPNQSQPTVQHKRKQVLMVRLRPEVPAPGVVSVLSDEHRQLGYIGLCTVESLESSRQEMTSALERFAGGKLVHSSRQFLDRDPQLRPEMV